MPEKWVIRRYRESDLARVMRIEKTCFPVDAYDRKLFAEFANLCGPLFLIVESSGRICGYGVACLKATGGAELVSIAVLPGVRGKGAAGALLAGLLRRLRSRGVGRISLMVREGNHGARRFYEKFGFQRMRRVAAYYEDGEDGVLMWREV